MRSSGGAATCWGVFSFASSPDLSRVLQWETSDEQMCWIRLHSLDTSKCYVPTFCEIKKSILLKKKKMNKRKNKKASHTKPERELYSQPQCRAQLRRKQEVFLLKFLIPAVFFSFNSLLFFSWTQTLCFSFFSYLQHTFFWGWGLYRSSAASDLFCGVDLTKNDQVERKSLKERRWKQL